MCPYCQQEVPLVFGPTGARCSACGASRSPFATATVSLAGGPRRLGGKLAAGMGWFVLLAGLALAAAVSGFGVLIFNTTMIAKFIGLPILLATSALGGGSLLLGSRLKKSGARELKAAQADALLRLAQGQGGAVTVPQVVAALGVSEGEADLLLTELAVAGEAQQEVTDDGELLYHFGPRELGPAPVRARVVSTGSKARGDDDIEELEAILEPPAAPGARAGRG